MLRILVGPNGCGKSKYLERFTGEPCRLPHTSGLEVMGPGEVFYDTDLNNWWG